MTPADLHWTAGFLQAMGCFNVDYWSGRGKPVAKLRIQSKDMVPLSRIKATFGGSIAPAGNAYRYQLVGKQVIRVAETFLPLLSAHRQAELATMINTCKGNAP